MKLNKVKYFSEAGQMLYKNINSSHYDIHICSVSEDKCFLQGVKFLTDIAQRTSTYYSGQTI